MEVSLWNLWRKRGIKDERERKKEEEEEKRRKEWERQKIKEAPLDIYLLAEKRNGQLCVQRNARIIRALSSREAADAWGYGVI